MSRHPGHRAPDCRCRSGRLADAGLAQGRAIPFVTEPTAIDAVGPGSTGARGMAPPVQATRASVHGSGQCRSERSQRCIEAAPRTLDEWVLPIARRGLRFAAQGQSCAAAFGKAARKTFQPASLRESWVEPGMTSSETGFPCALRTEKRSCCDLDEVEHAVGERPVRLELPAQVARRVAHGEPRVGGPRVAHLALEVGTRMLRHEHHDLEVLVLGEVRPRRDDVHDPGVGGEDAVPVRTSVTERIQSPSQVTRASIAPSVVPPRQPAVGSGRAKATIAADVGARRVAEDDHRRRVAAVLGRVRPGERDRAGGLGRRPPGFVVRGRDRRPAACPRSARRRRTRGPPPCGRARAGRPCRPRAPWNITTTGHGPALAGA